MRGNTIHYEIHGYLAEPERVSEPCWHPLFQYVNEHEARVVFDYIVADKDLPKYLDMYDDFRFVLPRPKLTREERQERRRRRAEREARKQGSKAASERSGAVAGTKKKARKAPRL